MRATLLAGCLALGMPLATTSASAQSISASTCPAGTPREQARYGWQQQAQGHWVEAEACLRSAVAVAADPWVQSRRAQLDSSLRVVSEHVGGLQVLGVPGARVRVDGVEVATLPMASIRVQATAVVVDVSAEGYRTAERRVEVPPGEQWVETILLVVVPRELVPPTTPVVVTAPVVQGPATVPTVHRSGDGVGGWTSPQSSSTLRTLGWASAIGAIGMVAVGAVAVGVRWSEVNTFNHNQCLENPQNPSIVYGGMTCASAHSDGGTWQSVAIGTFVAGGALAVASTALLFAAPRSPREARRPLSLRCGSGPGVFGISCGGMF